jgi:hypothetical protein
MFLVFSKSKAALEVIHPPIHMVQGTQAIVA